MISYFYDPSMFIYLWNSNFVCKVVLEREQGGRDAISCLLPCVLYCVWRVNLSKLSQNFIWTLTTTTTNCRVSFIHLFPTNFRIAFLPHTNAVIFIRNVLWYYNRAWVTCDENGDFCAGTKRSCASPIRRDRRHRLLVPLFGACVSRRPKETNVSKAKCSLEGLAEILPKQADREFGDTRDSWFCRQMLTTRVTWQCLSNQKGELMWSHSFSAN